MKTKKRDNTRERGLKLFTRYGKQQKILILSALVTFLLDVCILILAGQFQAGSISRQLQDLEVGRIAESDVVANQDITYTDVQKTEELREKESDTVLPVYTIDEGRVLDQIGHFERFTSFYLSAGQSLDADELYTELSLRFPHQFSREDAATLASTSEIQRIFPLVEERLSNLLENGIFGSLQDTTVGEGPILELWHWKDIKKVHEPYTSSQIITLDKIGEGTDELFSSYNLNGGLEKAGRLLLDKFTVQTAFYNPTLTSALKEDARMQVEPVTHTVRKGNTIISAGETVTSEDMETIQALREQRQGLSIKRVTAIVVYMAILFFLAYIMYAPLLARSRRTFQHSYILLIASLLFSINIFIIQVFTLIPSYLPLAVGVLTALICMMIATLLTQRIAIISSLLFSLFFFTLPDVGVYSFIFSFFAGITATYVIRNAEKRIDLVSGTMQLAFVMIFIMMVIGLFQQKSGSWYLSAGGVAVLYAFASGTLNLGLLPAIEHLLNAPTVFRLRELSDTSTPIFKRMITLAPGTYSHSMSVANLAESACKEIGANHLLARVGAYYHDIGKMDQPDYFIENQQEKNKHDDLTPNLSVAVIKSHVKIGKEKAKELKLPPEVVEIVSDHHGSDVIGYFYQQALKKNRDKVTPEEFSYNGSPPRSKESAVVMLADTVEAQSRTVKKPTMQKFEKMVWDAIMLKIGRKQLSNSVLSFQDIERIKNSFVQILAGQFHNRIEYPDQKDDA